MALLENSGFSFYNNVLGRPKYLLAPMVEQSELAFRLLCRDYGAQLFYTPMWHAGVFIADAEYRKAALQSCPVDRPLIVQFCANDPEKFARACELAEPHCDAMDLNLGCPQVIAKRGHYGSFLMEEIELVEKIISTAVSRVKKPITCKIRIFPEVEKTIEYAKRLERAGAKMITVHGRLRDQRGPLTGLANWDHVKAVKANLSIPVFSNGNIQYLKDVHECLEYTKVDGVMSAEGALYNPAIFTGRQPPVWEVAEKYLHYAATYKPPVSYVRGHLFRMWHHCLCKHEHLRGPMGMAKTFEELCAVSRQLTDVVKKDAEEDVRSGKDSEEPGSLPYWRCQPYVRSPAQKRVHEEAESCLESGNDLVSRVGEADADTMKFKKKRQLYKRLNGKGVFPKVAREKWPLCKGCQVNPWAQRCEYNRCRRCCREKSSLEVLDCCGHRFIFMTKKLKSATSTVGAVPSEQDLTHASRTELSVVPDKDLSVCCEEDASGCVAEMTECKMDPASPADAGGGASSKEVSADSSSGGLATLSSLDALPVAVT